MSLSLSRKVGEVIFIGDDVVVTVVQIIGKRVIINTKAPQEIRIRRGEVSKIDHGKQRRESQG